jgi:peptidoglycan/LPS O-acetylase OafA/YrhL
LKKTLIRQDIQGLRGISVLSVMLCHAWPWLVPGGFVGVDIFFVISGFVITNTIFRDYSTGRFSIANFYRRRVRRIFPALYSVLVFVLCASWIILSPQDYLELGKTALATVFFCSNIEFARLSGYFDGPASLKPLLNTWSLGVEEQFYVFYPIFIVLIHRYIPRFLRTVLIFSALASLAISVWMLKGHPSATFYLAPPRAFELLFGAIIACPDVRVTFSQRIRNSLSILGLAFIVIALAVYNHRTPFPGPAAILPCLGAALIILAGTGDGVKSFAGRIVSAKPLAWLGNLSYSLYLWHWPILVLTRQYLAKELVGREPDYLTVAACLIVSVAASMFSLRFIEKPFLDKRREKLPYLKIGLGAMVCAALLCLGVIYMKGVPERFSPASQALFAAYESHNPRLAECHNEKRSNGIPYDRNCIFGAKGVSPDVAVWGDSYSAELVVAIGERLGREGRSAMEISASACPPATDLNPKQRPYCSAHNSETLRRLMNDERIHTVILIANYSGYEDDGINSLFAGYRHVVDSLHGNGKRVIIVYPIPTFDFDPPVTLGMRNQYGKSLNDVGIKRQEFMKINEPAYNFLNAIYNSGAVDRVIPAQQLCDSDMCRAYDDKHGVLYFNSNHLSVAGERLIASKISL